MNTATSPHTARNSPCDSSDKSDNTDRSETRDNIIPLWEGPAEDNFEVIDPFANEIAIQKSAWVMDSLACECEICSVIFSLFCRKHHCRCCGKIFCYACTNYRIAIPDIQAWGRPCTAPPEKVCSSCYTKITNFKYHEQIYHIVSNLPLEITDLYRLLTVSRTWNRVVRYHLASFRRIFRRNSTLPFTSMERSLLWNNRTLFIYHSNGLLQLLLSLEGCAISGNKYRQLQALIENVGSPQPDLTHRVPCRHLLCTESCKSKLNTEEAVLCLSTPVKTPVFESWLMEILCTGSLTELLCYLPVLVSNLRWRGENTTLAEYLLAMAKDNYSFANSLFWEVSVHIENREYGAYYESFRSTLIESMGEDIKDKLQAGFYFVHNLVDMAKDPISFPNLITTYFETNREMSNAPIYSPVTPELILTGVKTEGVRVRGSSSRPISIPFTIRDGEVYELLYKHDDVRKDLIIMNIITLVDIILKREEGLDLNIITYTILPITSKEGFIEIVPNAETILSINTRKGFSILNFILEHNPTKSVEEVREIFMRSCVAYCILSYLLGIGDRHLENIMVLPSGELFHIDFGFILGSDPKPLAPEIRITDEMVDAMGGYESKHYTQFKELCARSFLCLRRHVSIFKVMFSCFYTADPPIDERLTKEYIDTFINNKFLVGENVSNAKLHLIHKVSNRSRGYSESIIDFCHKAQDETSTVNSLATSAMTIGSQLMGLLWKG